MPQKPIKTTPPPGFTPDGFVPGSFVPNGFMPDPAPAGGRKEPIKNPLPTLNMEDFWAGAGKEASKRVTQLGQLFYKVPAIGFASDVIGQAIKPGGASNGRLMAAASAGMEPANTSERLGSFAEQGAEFALPGPAMERAGASIVARVAPKVANWPAIVRGFVTAAPRAAIEGGGAAAITAGQGGDPRVGAALGALPPVLGATVGPVADFLKSRAGKQTSQFLDATTKTLKAEARRLEPGILERGLIGTQGQILNRAKSEGAIAGRASQRAVKAVAEANPGDVVPLQSALEAVDRVRRGAMTTDRAGNAVPRMGKESLVEAANYFTTWITAQGEKIGVEKAAALKTDWQEMARKAQQYMADDPTKVKGFIARKAGDAIRKELLTVEPNLEKVWADYGFWAGLEDVLQHTLDRTRPQKGWGKKVLSVGLASLGMGGGAMHGGTTEGLAFSGIIGTVSYVLQTPAYKLASAQLKNQLADAILSGNAKQVQFVATRILQAGAAQATR